MRVAVNEVSSHLCKILMLIIVKTHLKTGRGSYRIARRLVVICYNSAKSSETSKKASANVQERTRFPLDAQVEMAFITEIMPIFDA